MTAVLFVVFIVCLMLSFPVAIAMGIAAITPGMLDTALSADVVYIIRTMVVGIDSTPILAIPLFILSGTIMAQEESPESCLTCLPISWESVREVCHVL